MKLPRKLLGCWWIVLGSCATVGPTYQEPVDQSASTLFVDLDHSRIPGERTSIAVKSINGRRFAMPGARHSERSSIKLLPGNTTLHLNVTAGFGTDASGTFVFRFSPNGRYRLYGLHSADRRGHELRLDEAESGKNLVTVFFPYDDYQKYSSPRWPGEPIGWPTLDPFGP